MTEPTTPTATIDTDVWIVYQDFWTWAQITFGKGTTEKMYDCLTDGDDPHAALDQFIQQITKVRPTTWTHDELLDAYGRYDGDPRVSGPDDYEAFRDAIAGLPNLAKRNRGRG